MKLLINKAGKHTPKIGFDVFRWHYNDETEELEFDSVDTVIEMRIDEGDEESTKEVEEELFEEGFILGIGWENTGQLLHKDEYWSYTSPI